MQTRAFQRLHYCHAVSSSEKKRRRKRKTTPFRVKSTRRQVWYPAAQVSAHHSCHVLLSQEAERAGITIDQRSVPLKELQACMLAGSHLIIALVDKRRLCSGLMWSRPASLQVGGVNRMPIMCGYGDAYTGAALTPPAVACTCDLNR